MRRSWPNGCAIWTLKFLELRKLTKKLGGDLHDEEDDLPEELKLVRSYLKAWNVSI